MGVGRLAPNKLSQEQRIEEMLEVLQRCQSERLGTVKMGKSKSQCIFPGIVHQPRSFSSSSSMPRKPFKFTQVSRVSSPYPTFGLNRVIVRLDLPHRTIPELFRPDPWVYKLVGSRR